MAWSSTEVTKCQMRNNNENKNILAMSIYGHQLTTEPFCIQLRKFEQYLVSGLLVICIQSFLSFLTLLYTVYQDIDPHMITDCSNQFSVALESQIILSQPFNKRLLTYNFNDVYTLLSSNS